jgi:hypothetical protein
MLYTLLHLGFAILVTVMFVIALLAAVFGIVYFFTDRETTKLYNSWRGKK